MQYGEISFDVGNVISPPVLPRIHINLEHKCGDRPIPTRKKTSYEDCELMQP